MLPDIVMPPTPLMSPSTSPVPSKDCPHRERAAFRALALSASTAALTLTALMSSSFHVHLPSHAAVCASVTKRCVLSERAVCNAPLLMTPVRPATEDTESVLSIFVHARPLDTTQSPVRTPRDCTTPEEASADAMKYTPSYCEALEALRVTVSPPVPYLSLNAADTVATDEPSTVPP